MKFHKVHPPPPPPPIKPPPKLATIPRDTSQEYPPGNKAPGTWYMYLETTKVDDNNQFHGVFIVFQQEGLPQRGAFVCVELDTLNFTSTWDTQVEKAKMAIDRLNDFNQKEETSLCATCGESFGGDDYLCKKCREAIPQEPR